MLTLFPFKIPLFDYYLTAPGSATSSLYIHVWPTGFLNLIARISYSVSCMALCITRIVCIFKEESRTPIVHCLSVKVRCKTLNTCFAPAIWWKRPGYGCGQSCLKICQQHQLNWLSHIVTLRFWSWSFLLTPWTKSVPGYWETSAELWQLQWLEGRGDLERTG